MKKGLIRILLLLLLLSSAAAEKGNQSAALRERVDGMWEIWAGSWSRSFLDGEVYLPQLWRDLPFLTWPDEAPIPEVREENGKTEITFSETIGEEWRVCLGKGMPIEYQECVYDESMGCWRGEGSFDSVILISDMTDQRIGISIGYQRENEFRPSYPVLEWGREEGDEILGFSCYGWGTTRSFQGGMYAIASEKMSFYAEYNSEGFLTAWYDGVTGCQYDLYDQLVEGEEPERYAIQIVH